MKVIFSHGKESGPWGSKISKLANRAKKLGFDADSLDYSDLPNADERVLRLMNYIENETQPYILVGSSMGGYVSLVAAKECKPHGVFLLAPALYMPGYKYQNYSTSCTNIAIIHGWSDDVIPIDNVIKYARQSECSLHLIDGDHRLNSSLESVAELFEVFLKKLNPVAVACSE